MLRVNLRNAIAAILLLALFLAGCDDAKIRQARKHAAAASISIGKSIEGLKTLNEQNLITDQQEREALDFLDRVNNPLLEAGKKLKGVTRETWDGVKGDVLGQVDKALKFIDQGGNLVFKSPEAKATFNASLAVARVAIQTFRNSLAAIRSA